MSIHRAARAASSFLLVACACLFAVPSALAQDQAGVVLTLQAQTAFTSLQDPELRVIVAARNDSEDTFDSLSVFITIGQAIRSRNQYDASLTQGPGLSPVVARVVSVEHASSPVLLPVLRHCRFEDADPSIRDAVGRCNRSSVWFVCSWVRS